METSSKNEIERRLERLYFYNTASPEDRERFNKKRILGVFEGESLTPRQVSDILSYCRSKAIEPHTVEKYMNDLVDDELLIKESTGEYVRNF